MFFHSSPPERPDRSSAEGKLIPLLPLRDIIVFPSMVVPLFVGRDRSVHALEEAMGGNKEILLAAQRKAKTNDPTPDEIYRIGTVGVVVQLLRLPDGTVKVLIEGKRRARILQFVPNKDFFLCEIEGLQESKATSVEAEALVRSVQTAFEAYAKLNKRIPPETLMNVQSIDDAGRLSDTIIGHLSSVKIVDRQALLETTDSLQRLEKLFGLVNAEIEILQVEKKIRSRVRKQMEKTQKEYYLNEQMQAIQRELGERDEFKSEIQELEESAKNKQLSPEAQERVKKELKKLKMMQPMSAEATVVRNYIDWILQLPWGEKKQESYDIRQAEEVLNHDHFGLTKVKERILEHLAVHALVKRQDGPVLCLVGPPGVGKTSLARSIARATGRSFVRLSLGGVRDEAEIRGHRRTYIGALPGRIIQSLRKAGSNNPVFLLDEVDKMSADFRGDPAAALLEVLDPEQNHTFNDHYLDLDYDLSDVMFVTTANTLSGIPLPLQDRMEIIELSGYTEFEKLNIARRYLVPRQLEKAGLKNLEVDITDNALRAILHHYTKESGVRNLEREVGNVCRKIARRHLEELSAKAEAEEKAAAGDKTETANSAETANNAEVAVAPTKVSVPAKLIPRYLGVPRYSLNKAGESDEIGLTTGLAYTAFGGTTLDCEVTVVPGKGKLMLTGLLEKGMQESAQAAMSYIRSRQKLLGLDEDFYQKYDFHVHFPEFVPKDGPSAGITMATSIASALMRIPVRKSVAMTGEITLRGRILGIGGLKEKILAAHRAGIETVLIPRENRKDLREIPRRALNLLRVLLVQHMDEVLMEALCLHDPRAIFGERPRPAEYRPSRTNHADVDNQSLDSIQPTGSIGGESIMGAGSSAG